MHIGNRKWISKAREQQCSGASAQRRESKQPDYVQEEPQLVNEKGYKLWACQLTESASIRECYSPNSLSHQHCEFLTQMNSCLHVGVYMSGRCPLSQYQPIHHCKFMFLVLMRLPSCSFPHKTRVSYLVRASLINTALVLPQLSVIPDNYPTVWESVMLSESFTPNAASSLLQLGFL